MILARREMMVVLRLIRFELKKMLDTKLALVVNTGVLLLLCIVMVSNITQQRTTSNVDVQLHGTAAIAQAREVRQAHAGTLTADRIANDITQYRAIAFEKIDPSQIVDLSDAAAYDLMSKTYSQDTLTKLYDSYYTYLLSPWKVGAQEPYQVAANVDGGEAANFYTAVAQGAVFRLDGGMGDTWTYTDAERAYWTSRQAEVLTPFEYGYEGGWDDILDCTGFLIFAMLSICVTLASVFAGEYQARTDSVLLASRHGRSKLVGAKIIASFLYATVVFAIAAIIICGIPLAFSGADGGTLPIQNTDLAIPYSFTMSQAVFLEIGIAYVMTLGFAALTLLLSSRMRSMLGVFIVDMVLIIVTGMIPSGGNAIVKHIEYLFPYGAASASFSSFISYPFGDVVLDLIGMIVIVYLLLAAICIPLSAVSFRRHQVV